MTQAILDDTWLRRYEEVLGRIREKQEYLRGTVVPRLNSLVTSPALALGLPGALVRPTVVSALNGLESYVFELDMLLESAGLPLRLAYDVRGWLDVHDRVAAAPEQLAITTPHVRQSWHGLSAYAYLYVHDTQRHATDRLAEVCGTTVAQLRSAGENALKLYVAVLASIDAIALAFGAGVALLAVGDLMQGGFALGAAVTLFAAFLQILDGAQQSWGGRARELAELVDGLREHGTFPGSRWPPANPAGYRDGSVSDGTPTDWTPKGAGAGHGPLPG